MDLELASYRALAVIKMYAGLKWKLARLCTPRMLGMTATTLCCKHPAQKPQTLPALA